jgi:thioredoxin-dependent peroxiredoxin
MPAIGETAPDFELLNDEGNHVKLSDFRGKKVVLYFYPEDFTQGCELQACNFRDHYPEIQDKNAVVIGISPDGVARHKEFRDALKLPFHLLVDSDHAVSEKWGCWGIRTNDDGTTVGRVMRGQYVIDEDGRIIAVHNPVKPADSVPMALSAL